MFDRLAIYGVPLIAGVVTTAVLLGPGNERPAVGVEVHGLVATGAPVCAFRLHSKRHLADERASVALDGLTLVVRHDGRNLGRWSGHTDESGFAEALVPLAEPARGRLHVTVERSGVSLLDTTFAVTAPLISEPPTTAEAVAGTPPLWVRIPRGFGVPEHAEPVEVVADFPGQGEGNEPPTPTLVVEAAGADIQQAPPKRHCADDGCGFRWRLDTTPRAPTVQLTITATSGDGHSRWSGQLPVQPGGMWLDPDSHDPLVVRAAVPQQRLYVSMLSRHGRFWGGSVPMQHTHDGRAHAELPRPDRLAKGAIAVVLSSEPDEPDGATVSWPLYPDLGSVQGTLQRVGDGMPAALLAEDARRARARLPAFGLVAAAAVFELLYLFLRWRRSQRKLEAFAHVADKSAQAMTVRTPLWWLTLLVGGLVLVFTLLALMTALA